MKDTTSYIQQLLDTVTQLAVVIERAERLLRIWNVRGYTPDTIDAQKFGISDADISNVLYLVDSLIKFIKGEAHPTEKFISTLDRMRNDL